MRRALKIRGTTLAGVVACLLLAVPADAALPGSTGTPAPWVPVLGGLAPRGPGGAPVETRPRAFEASRLDKRQLRASLAGAPLEDTRAARTAPVVVRVPAPDGTLDRFALAESPVLAPALARRFPQIRTYAGESLDHPGETGRFDLGPLGFHASVRSKRGTWYVDPYYKGDDGVHVAYYRSALRATASPVVDPGETDQLGRAVRAAPAARAAGAVVTRRVYRLALANDPSYAEYFHDTDLLVETAKAALMNRVNQLYNDDLAIRMELVGNDYLLNFNTPAKYTAAGYTYDGECDGNRLDENQAALDRIVKPANYDIGHIVLGLNGGGIAQLDSVGRNGQKAQGCTGVPGPVGDGFAIDYVAHEMGHQFGGPHTFDGNKGNCGGGNHDATGAASVEPGSGSSVMAYAGICGTDDLQANSDPYFSQSSIADIQAYVNQAIAGATNGGAPETVANDNPAVTAPADRTIPVRTPFTLTGSATDADGDNLVYLWEQNDPSNNPAGTALTTAPAAKTRGPLFRVFSDNATEDPSQSPAPGQNVATAAARTRTFPDPAQIAADNTDAESGACPAGSADAVLDCNSEVLPTATYAATSGQLDFRLTARDRSPAGGGVDHDDVTLTLAPTAGPFAVTGPTPTGTPLTGGGPVTVTWNVASTNVAPVGATDVRVTYSTDGGLTFNYVALASTPNTGSAVVTVPNLATTQGRFRVEAIGNYFFDVSDGNLTVTADPAGPVPTATASPEPEPSPAPPVPPLTVPTATMTPSPSPSPSPGPSPSPSPSPTPSSSEEPPTPTVSPTPEPPASAALRPDLAPTPRSRRVTRARRVAVRVRCLAVGLGKPAPQCSGRARLYARIGGRRTRIGRARFTAATGSVKTVRLRIRRAAYRRLSGGRRLRATLRADAAGRTAAKRIRLRR